MCGICGLVGFDPAPDIRDALIHRGPDGTGNWSDARCTLGFRRLAIIDIEGGSQPMSNEDGTLHLVLNGEIYNHKDLRRELEGRGHRFRSRCDAEAALHLFEQEGPECVVRLRGMFALAIWNSKDRSLFLARDAMGKKPLVYWTDGGRLAFASEIQALLKLGFPREVDAEALNDYLATGVIAAPRTGVRNIRKLPPGHWAMHRNGKLEIQKYRAPFPAPSPIARDEAVRRVRAAVEEAVDARLESDVPLGAFLSGGIDSTIVTGLMAGRGPVQTYSIAFDDPTFDESGHARLAAAAFHTTHREFKVVPDGAALLPVLVRHFGEPFADASAIPTFELARHASKHVKVALSGDGGDEAFGGYLRHRAIRMLARLKRLPAPLRWAARLAPVDRKYRLRTQALLRDLSRPLGTLYGEFLSPFDAATRQALRPGFAMPTPYFDEGDPVAAAGRHDLEHYLPDDLMVKTDIASMAHGLEVRSPFLDAKVVALSQGLPGSLKIEGRTTKAILRHAFRDLLPPEIRDRSKQGFGVPLDAWLRGPLKAMRDEHLLGSTSPHFDRATIQRLVKEHDAGADHGRALWALIFFEAWIRWLERP